MSNVKMNYELEGIRQEAVVAYFQEPLQRFLKAEPRTMCRDSVLQTEY
jgi:hypothetical protein